MTSIIDISQQACRSQDDCPLFTRLPAELRTYIYECVLTARPEDDYGCIRLTRHLPDEHAPPSVLTLLKTCRLVYAEAMAIFYQQNRFRLHYGTLFATYDERRGPFRNMSPNRLAHLQHLVVDASSFGAVHHACILLAGDAPGLRYLRFILRDLHDSYAVDGPDRDKELLDILRLEHKHMRLALRHLRNSLKELHLIWEDSSELDHPEPRGWQEYGAKLGREKSMKILMYRRGPVKTSVN